MSSEIAVGARSSPPWSSWRDELEGREVAVKCVHVSGPGGQARVRREVAALRLLDLPGVVHIVDDGQGEGEPFVVMVLVPGQPFPGRDHAGD